MNKIGVDLIGQVNLLKESHRTKPFIKHWWGQANVKDQKQSDSYYIYLLNKETLDSGETAQAEFKFKFSSDERFKIELELGQIIELKEGMRKIGEFVIQKIVNQILVKK